MAKPYEASFKQREAQQYLKPGEMRRLLSPIDRQVMNAIHGPRLAGYHRRITPRGIERATGLSAIAVILSTYRLVGLGLINEKPRPMPKRTDTRGSYPHQRRKA